MNNKAEKYTELVQSVKQKYRYKQKDKNARFTWCDLKDDEDLCKEINLWTYWQGWNYAQETPEIKYLLLGQDFGPPAKEEKKGTIANVRRLNAGDTAAMFQDGVELGSRDAQTDNKLIELFELLDHPKIDKQRYSDLFFCNFCLGYRKENYSGKISKKDFRADKDAIRALVDILNPEHIICLGKNASVETIRVLCDLNYSDKSMDELIAMSGIPEYNGAKIHPMAHPGYWGTKNRGEITIDNDWKNIV